MDTSTPYLDLLITADGEELLAERLDVSEVSGDWDFDALVARHADIARAAAARGAEVWLSVTDPDGALPPIRTRITSDGTAQAATDDDGAAWERAIVDFADAAATLLVRAAHERDAQLTAFLQRCLQMGHTPGPTLATLQELGRRIEEAAVAGVEVSPPPTLSASRYVSETLAGDLGLLNAIVATAAQAIPAQRPAVVALADAEARRN
jgi:hypothetical protein